MVHSGEFGYGGGPLRPETMVSPIQTRQRNRLATLVLVGVVTLATGCGDEEDFANEPRPPSPIRITSTVTPDAISVSQNRFGAGEVTLKIVNQTDSSQTLVLRSTGSSGGSTVEQRTAPINPSDVASVTANLRPGTYELAADTTSSIKAARITVGPERPSAKDQLLQP